MRRRDFIKAIAGSTVFGPLAARAQQAATGAADTLPQTRSAWLPTRSTDLALIDSGGLREICSFLMEEQPCPGRDRFSQFDPKRPFKRILWTLRLPLNDDGAGLNGAQRGYRRLVAKPRSAPIRGGVPRARDRDRRFVRAERGRPQSARPAAGPPQAAAQGHLRARCHRAEAFRGRERIAADDRSH